MSTHTTTPARAPMRQITWRCTVVDRWHARRQLEITASCLTSVYALLDVAFPARRAEFLVRINPAPAR